MTKVDYDPLARRHAVERNMVEQQSPSDPRATATTAPGQPPSKFKVGRSR